MIRPKGHKQEWRAGMVVSWLLKLLLINQQMGTLVKLGTNCSERVGDWQGWGRHYCTIALIGGEGRVLQPALILRLL